MLRSIRLTVISMLPNILPVVGSLAYLGLTGTELDIGNSIFATCALGLVVDDTGHIVTRFKDLLGTGVTAAAAAKRSIAELRRPVVTTTLAIVIGLSVLNFSELVPFHSFSQILILSLLLALFGDAILLPALLTHFGETEKDRNNATGGSLDRFVDATAER
jgi:predicted RND superfamily exporter protein